MTEYEYEYYSVSQKWPNTNTNIIRSPKNDRIRIRILFGYPEMTEYRVLKEEHSPTHFSEDWLIRSSEKWKCGDKFSCAHLSRIWAHLSKVSMLSKIFIVFKIDSQWYSVWENHPNTNTNNIRFQKVTRIRIRIIFSLRKSPEYEYE